MLYNIYKINKQIEGANGMSAIELSHDHINAMMQIARGDALRRSYYYKGESY